MPRKLGDRTGLLQHTIERVGHSFECLAAVTQLFAFGHGHCLCCPDGGRGRDLLAPVLVFLFVPGQASMRVSMGHAAANHTYSFPILQPNCLIVDRAHLLVAVNGFKGLGPNPRVREVQQNRPQSIRRHIVSSANTVFPVAFLLWSGYMFTHVFLVSRSFDPSLFTSRVSSFSP